MTFEKFWEAIVERNQWRSDLTYKVTDVSLRALAEQAYNQGFKHAKDSPFSEILGGFTGF